MGTGTRNKRTDDDEVTVRWLGSEVKMHCYAIHLLLLCLRDGTEQAESKRSSHSCRMVLSEVSDRRLRGLMHHGICNHNSSDDIRQEHRV